MKKDKKNIIALLLAMLMLTIILPLSVQANPANSNLSNDHVEVFTSGGKPVWVKLSLPSGGKNITLNPGGSVSIRLDYCFDASYKPAAGDTLEMYLSGFPKGTFLLPSNMHTSGNMYRDGVITLKFENIGNYQLQNGVDGWMTVTFYASRDEQSGAFEPQILGNGSVNNILNIERIIIEELEAEPGPPQGGAGNWFSLLRKLSEHVLYPNGNGGYIMDLYQYHLPVAPAYISYEVLLNEGSGEEWEKNHIGDFDYFLFTDTLGDGHVFANDGEPYSWSDYTGTAPIYSISAWRPSIDGGNEIVNCAVDRTDPKVHITVSEDRKSFALKIEKGAKILGPGGSVIGSVDEFTMLRIDYYSKVTDDTMTAFKNNCEVSYAKNDEVTSGHSDITINVIQQSGAAFVYKTVGKGNENYYDIVDAGLHGYDNPLLVELGDELIYTINYKVTGDEGIPAGNLEMVDTLENSLEFMYQITGHSGAFAVTQDSQNPQKLTLKNNWDFEKGQTYSAFFRVKVKELAAGEVVTNSIGTNTTVVKKDGYAIQLRKYDADDNQTFLPGTEFELYTNVDNSWIPYYKNGNPVVLITGNDGRTGISSLPVGKYLLIESKAPDGYPALPETNPIVVEFEILPNAPGLNNIDRILVIDAPGNMPNPVDDMGTAVFSIPNDKESTPTGNLMVIKDNTTKIDARKFYVTLTTDDGSFLKFDAVTGGYMKKSNTEVQIEINDTMPVLLKDIPLSVGAITVTETASSSKGYDVTYSIGGKTENNVVTLTENKQTVFVTVTNKQATGTGSLTIAKAFSANDDHEICGADNDTEFSVRVRVKGTTQYLTVSGAYPNYTYKAANMTGDEITIKAAGEAVISGIPKGSELVVEEHLPEGVSYYGLTASYSSESVTVPVGSTTQVTVTNTFAYNPNATGLVLRGLKTVTGKELVDGQFSFAVYEGNSRVALGTNSADGEVVFS